MRGLHRRPGGLAPRWLLRSTRATRFFAVSALTLIEVLVVVAIIAVLMSVLLPGMSLVKDSARSLRCMENLRQVAMKFRLYADELGYRSRGRQSGGEEFTIEDFQESLYRIDHYWDRLAEEAYYDPADEIMMCPEAPQHLKRRAKTPCSAGAVTPFESVSFGFNARLDRASVVFHGAARLVPIPRLPGRIIEQPFVPLALDVDGGKAKNRGIVPYYTAPPVDTDDAYADGKRWFPSTRHRGKTNIAFIGGHVVRSPAPEEEKLADWGYQPSGTFRFR